ncbi:hypothetical protein XM48_07710, partial [Leucobacter sp. Ag1]
MGRAPPPAHPGGQAAARRPRRLGPRLRGRRAHEVARRAEQVALAPPPDRGQWPGDRFAEHLDRAHPAEPQIVGDRQIAEHGGPESARHGGTHRCLGREHDRRCRGRASE